MADGKWQGTDVDLETSLFEYNFVAKQRADKDHPDEWFVLYKMGNNAFGTGHIRESELDDLINGKEWMKEEDIERTLSYVGMTKKEWLKESFINKLSDLLSYWGNEEIMGSDYNPLDKKGALKMIGIENDENESKARNLIEDLKFMDGPKQPEGSSDIIDDKLNKEVTILQGILMNRRLGTNASLQTGNGAMVNILALGAKNDEVGATSPEETPEKKPEDDKENTTAAAKVIGAASSICATEGKDAQQYVVSFNKGKKEDTLSILKKMDADLKVDPEGNPSKAWIKTSLPLRHIERLDGVLDAIPSTGGNFK